MLRLELEAVRTATDAARSLRSASFPGPVPCDTDEFDARSWHVLLRGPAAPAAYARLTIGVPGVFNSWTSGAAGLPEGHDIADLGRCCVAPEFRRLELFRAIVVAGCSLADRLGCHTVNGAYIPGRYLARTLHDVGFVPRGAEVVEREPNGGSVPIQPAVLDVRSARARWRQQWAVCVSAAARRGIRLPLAADEFVV